METSSSKNDVDYEIENINSETENLSNDINYIFRALELGITDDSQSYSISIHTNRAVQRLFDDFQNNINRNVENIIKIIMKINLLDDDEKAILIRQDPNIMKYIINPSEFLQNVEFYKTNI